MPIPMDESLKILDHDHPVSPSSYSQKPAGSGLTLVLPPLRGGKPMKSAKKGRYRSQDDENMQEKRIPRPVKLKPLKDVLSKLIAQIKKKDDYAFFLRPVDVSHVPGYSDLVKRPMDLGTMTNKVNRGKYRSLEEFAADFRLVTGNSKLFNPPESIYHIEAHRIETWGLEHIAKAASTVIQYETDWNIEIEKDDDGQTVNVDDEEDFTPATPMEVDDPGPSVRASSVTPQVSLSTRRATRGPYNKKVVANPSTTISESIDAEGRMPGSREGLGAFPSSSDWARTMVALKLKGKRYKTKKERLRVEKDGPPMLPDGTLDYFEMEDPFSVLQALVPDPPSHPTLSPLYPPFRYMPTSTVGQSESEPSQSQPPPFSSFPAATTALQTSEEQIISTIPPPLLTPFTSPPWSYSSAVATTTISPRKIRHWAIVRNPPSRGKGKEKEDDSEQPEVPFWQLPREAHVTDYGSYSLLSAALAQEMYQRGVVGKEGEEEELVRHALKESLECQMEPKEDSSGTKEEDPLAWVAESKNIEKEYWTSERAAEGEDYIRDIVYGGVEGLAYIRSLAEFVKGAIDNESSMGSASSSAFLASSESTVGIDLANWVERNIVDELTEGRHSVLRRTALLLNESLSCQDEKTDLDDLISRQLLSSLQSYPAARVALSTLLRLKEQKIDMSALIKTPNELFVSEKVWIGKVFKERRKALRKKVKDQEDCGSVTTPSGANGVVSVHGTLVVKEEEEEDEVDTATSPTASAATSVNGVTGSGNTTNGTGESLGDDDDDDMQMETPEELNHVLEHVTRLIAQLDQQIRLGSFSEFQGKGNICGSVAKHSGGDGGGRDTPGMTGDTTPDRECAHDSDIGVVTCNNQDGSGADASMTAGPGVAGSTGIAMQGLQSQSQYTSAIDDPTFDGGADSEPDAFKNLRLNLLALAKRAPLDTIARLPKDLVPEHIRQYVPTLGSN